MQQANGWLIQKGVSRRLVRVRYREADDVLANSGRKPFGADRGGTMAAGGTAVTGNKREEYAWHMDNTVVLDTADPC
jgi:hypothetical protein